ncbi:MAG: GntR family transcriptional regulator [Actinomycetia bacterium]|nr:GntR family transcriptional regulator [Actinomycetes bacterium]
MDDQDNGTRGGSRRPPGADAEAKRYSRTEQAFGVIQQALIDLTYPPGSSFTEGEIAASLGLTKTPVREALLMLSANGLVAARPGSGYLVMPITLRDVRSLFKHWRRLESDAAALTASSGMSSHFVMHLRDLVHGTGGAESMSTIERDAELHAWIVATSQDVYLDRDFDRLIVEIVRLYRLTIGEDPEGMAEDHVTLLTEILSDDPERARSAVLTYVDRIEKLVIEDLLTSDALLTTNLGLRGR